MLVIFCFAFLASSFCRENAIFKNKITKKSKMDQFLTQKRSNIGPAPNSTAHIYIYIYPCLPLLPLLSNALSSFSLCVSIYIHIYIPLSLSISLFHFSVSLSISINISPFFLFSLSFYIYIHIYNAVKLLSGPSCFLTQIAKKHNKNRGFSTFLEKKHCAQKNGSYYLVQVGVSKTHPTWTR